MHRAWNLVVLGSLLIRTLLIKLLETNKFPKIPELKKFERANKEIMCV